MVDGGGVIVLLADDVLEQVRRAIQGREHRRNIARAHGDAEAVIRHSEVIDELDDILYVFEEQR